MTSEQKLGAIANDLNLCDVGIALTKGKLKAKYVKQRKICLDALSELNEKDGLNEMTIDEILAELES